MSEGMKDFKKFYKKLKDRELFTNYIIITTGDMEELKNIIIKLEKQREDK
tara:strand:+ start:746 stop:895 length:150 start_codon:yes stop_codon:yes gene_type:complete